MTQSDDPKNDPLWQRITKDVTPLDRRNQHQEATPKVNPSHNGGIKRIERPQTAPSFDGADETSGIDPVQGLDRSHKRRLARGTADIDQVIDLHGLSREKAYAVLARQIPKAALAGKRVLLVITGKGGARFQQQAAVPVDRRRRSDFALHEGVLRKALPEWLNSAALRPYVAALDEAGDAHGGAGAFYLRLKRQKK